MFTALTLTTHDMMQYAQQYSRHSKDSTFSDIPENHSAIQLNTSTLAIANTPRISGNKFPNNTF